MDSRPDLSKVAGPNSMSSAAPSPRTVSYAAAASASQPQSQSQSRNPAASARLPGLDTGSLPKKKRHRAGKKRRNRRQSFIAPSDTNTSELEQEDQRPSLLETTRPSAGRNSFYRLKSAARSNTSLESEALLDHRDQQPLRTRRQSFRETMFASRGGSMPTNHRPTTHKSHPGPILSSSPMKTRHMRSNRMSDSGDDDDDVNDRTPLMSSARRERPSTSNRPGSSHVGYGSHRRSSPVSISSRSSKRGRRENNHRHPATDDEDYDVNNPPSVPGSPKLGTLDDVMIAEQFSNGRSPAHRDTVIDIDRDASSDAFTSTSPISQRAEGRRHTVHNLAENDVCYPGDADMSVIGEEDHRPDEGSRTRDRRRRRRRWPDLQILEDWSIEENEEKQQQENTRAKKVSEPVLVGGRLRPKNPAWHRQEDDAPFRYTYFNETFDGTIHSRNISELMSYGHSFKELFIPDPLELSDESSDEDDEHNSLMPQMSAAESGRQSRVENNHGSKTRETSGSLTPAQSQTTPQPEKAKRYGPRPTFWLDVLSPTETEMKVLSKAFGIHQLTSEDILMQEPREKVELFQHYYFVNYRSFEQDQDSEDYMEPVNMFVVVFREGVISFHFSMTPHPANVRRRIRQLNDYMSPTADWMSYAIIDDITDVYGPLVQQIEDEVDDIDDYILRLHSPIENSDEKPRKSGKAKELEYEKMNKSASSDTRSESGDPTSGDNGGDMLRRVGEGRKKVMTLYRLLGNKADVIKGFAKRCNEHWDVAPRSEIGLYLGDIQDHIVTMTSNLSHYENLLSRAHSNYLAQINIRMNERAEQTNDVLGKLTVLGTIVLPMNIVTGIFGCNFLVPGQDVENLNWFWSVCGALLGFGMICYFIARRVYGIV